MITEKQFSKVEQDRVVFSFRIVNNIFLSQVSSLTLMHFNCILTLHSMLARSECDDGEETF